jgi:hypothetical protein
MINGKVRDESFLFIQIRGSSDIVYWGLHGDVMR